MNRKNAARTIQRALLIIALIAVAHAVRPFTARNMTRHLVRATQSFSFVLPGAALSTVEQADYLAAILDGSFSGDQWPTQPGVGNSDIALAGSQFNPEHDSVVSPTMNAQPELQSRCPLAAKREAQAQEKRVALARSAPAIRSGKVAGAAIASSPRSDKSAKAEEMIAVVLPEAQHAEMPLVWQSDLARMQEMARSATAKARRNVCDSVLPEVSRVRAARVSVMTEDALRAVAVIDLKGQAEAVRKANNLKLSIHFVPASGEWNHQPELKLKCARPKTDQPVKC
jgi:hypothetical protein